MNKMQKVNLHNHFYKSNHFIVIGPGKISLKDIHPLHKHVGIFTFIDAGLKHLPKLKKYISSTVPMVSFGDGDSSKSQMTYPKLNQNQSDLAFFLSLMKKNKIYGLYHFQGFLGGRLDHELINLGEIIQFIDSIKTPKNNSLAIIEKKILCLPPGKHKIHLNGIFSIISHVDSNLTLKGHCDFQILKPKILKSISSQGLSNKGFGKIEISTNQTVVIIAQKKQDFLKS